MAAHQRNLLGGVYRLGCFVLEDPRVANCAAPDQHCSAAGVLLHAPDVRRRAHIAVSQHRDVQLLPDLRNCVPVCCPLVSLRARAPVHCQRTCAAARYYLRNFEVVALVVVPTDAHLGGHRHLQFTRQRAKKLRHAVRKAQHARPGTAFRNVFYVAAHVNVDDIRLQFLQAHGCAHNAVHIVPVNLKGNGPLGRVKHQLLLRAPAAAMPPLQLVHIHKFCVAHGGAQSAAHRAKRQIRVAVHWRKNHIAINWNFANMKAWLQHASIIASALRKSLFADAAGRAAILAAGNYGE